MESYNWARLYLDGYSKYSQAVVAAKLNLMQAEINELKIVRENLLREIDKWQDLYLREKVR